jgi:hypothetical protein
MRHGRLGVRGPGGPLQCLRVQETRPLGVEPRKEGELVLVRYSKGPIGESYHRHGIELSSSGLGNPLLYRNPVLTGTRPPSPGSDIGRPLCLFL